SPHFSHITNLYVSDKSPFARKSIFAIAVIAANLSHIFLKTDNWQLVTDNDISPQRLSLARHLRHKRDVNASILTQG
ncbi:MAG: hypothetical protein K8L97_09030, partial [Anaerolineae bacterium]|nr:hypothetical protein [Anaerolineae bacterium]